MISFTQYRTLTRLGLCVSLLVSVSACSFMPSAGPHASLILDKSEHTVPVVDVTEQSAALMQSQQQAAYEAELQRVLTSINVPARDIIVVTPGDVISVALWSQSADVNTSLATAPHPQEMGNYAVGFDGSVNMPYIGHINVRGMTPARIEAVIAKLFESLRLFPEAVASVRVMENKSQNIVIMGAVNAPNVLNWSEGGIDLDEAVAKAGGFKIFDPSRQGSDLSVNNVLLLRKGQRYNIPLDTALSYHVPLHPGDRVVLQHEPVVRALCVGGGWKSPTTVSFDKQPTLAEVLSGAGDLNIQTAQGRSIFVFKHDKRVIYRVNFDQPDGVAAAQKFPIDDRDLVYVPVTRSVTLQQVVSMIMSVGYPATMGAAIK